MAFGYHILGGSLDSVEDKVETISRRLTIWLPILSTAGFLMAAANLWMRIKGRE